MTEKTQKERTELMEKKEFEPVSIEIIEMSNTDVILTSVTPPNAPGYDDWLG